MLVAIGLWSAYGAVDLKRYVLVGGSVLLVCLGIRLLFNKIVVSDKGLFVRSELATHEFPWSEIGEFGMSSWSVGFTDSKGRWRRLAAYAPTKFNAENMIEDLIRSRELHDRSRRH